MSVPSSDIGSVAPEMSPDNIYPDVNSPTDSVIAGDFGSLSATEQEALRQNWKRELTQTEEEIVTLRQVLASKEKQAEQLKRRLGITSWREFSDDMHQGLRNLQDSQAYKKTAESLNLAKEKTADLWTSMVGSSNHAISSVGEKTYGLFSAAKSKMSQSMSSQNINNESNLHAPSKENVPIPEEKM